VSAPILSARGIVNRFGSQVVHDGISLDVEPGEIVGIAGGSGSGKSVLLRTLTGLQRPSEGEVLVDGKPVTEIRDAERASLIGVLFQNGALFSSLSVAQNIMLPIRQHTDVGEAEREKIAAMKLELAGCLPKAASSRPPSSRRHGEARGARARAGARPAHPLPRRADPPASIR
jgi:phospholipid/cholesterol/gamma-HCH transport system ATP-binding protein